MHRISLLFFNIALYLVMITNRICCVPVFFNHVYLCFQYRTMYIYTTRTRNKAQSKKKQLWQKMSFWRWSHPLPFSSLSPRFFHEQIKTTFTTMAYVLLGLTILFCPLASFFIKKNTICKYSSSSWSLYIKNAKSLYIWFFYYVIYTFIYFGTFTILLTFLFLPINVCLLLLAKIIRYFPTSCTI